MIPPPEEIIVLNDYASTTGGSTAVAIASACRLASHGFRVTFFSCVGPVAPRLRETPGLEVICLDQPEIARDPHRLRAFASGLRNRAALAALRGLLARKDPARTVVHAHTWTKALSPCALHEVVTRDFPLVVSLHDFFITCPTGGFFDHATDRICERRPLSAGCLSCRCDRRNYRHKLWRCARTFLQNRWLGLPRAVAHYIGVSAFSLRVLRPHLPPAARVSVVQHPVDAIDAGPAPVADNRDFLFVGRLVPEKGVRLFAEAALLAGLPATFVGDGEFLAEARRLCPRARFAGWLPPAALRAEFRQARALVFPPLWYETLGLVTIEAAAAGVPSIVSDRCAATDHIRHEQTGLHFAHGSVAALARAMRTIAANDVLAARLGAQAYRWYWENPWTEDRHVAHLLEIYRSLFSTPTAGSQEAP